MLSPRTNADAVGGPQPIRVGRLQPVPGVTLRAHPDRDLVGRLLEGLRVPLSVMQSVLDPTQPGDLPEAARMVLAAAHHQSEYLLGLVREFAELGELEQDRVVPRPERVAVGEWWDACLVELRAAAAAVGIGLRPRFRSFLPSHVVLDAGLASRSFAAVMRVALLRALPGEVALRVAWDDGRLDGHRGRLAIEIVTRGGGFGEFERGYVFAPFAVYDAAARPLLGLSIAQRLCELLGGGLSVHGPGPAECTYRLEFAAQPAAGATWRDPLAAWGDFGAVKAASGSAEPAGCRREP